MQHPDLIIVQAEEESRVLKVEQVREVQHNLALAPYEASYKIALFLNFLARRGPGPGALITWVPRKWLTRAISEGAASRPHAGV